MRNRIDPGDEPNTGVAEMQPPRSLRVTGVSFLLTLLTGTCLFLTGCREEEASPALATTDAVLPATHDLLTQPPPETGKALNELHKRGVSAFLNEPGFGHFRLPPMHHPFAYPQVVQLPSNSAGLTQEWQVTKLELIGLARHPEPIVFMNGMPQGEKRKEPTRLPDEIENAALVMLKKGSELAFSSAPRQIRVVGALRSQESCVTCHKDVKDNLLGALSYTLRPAVPSDVVRK
jgi:hypothetical protein